MKLQGYGLPISSIYDSELSCMMNWFFFILINLFIIQQIYMYTNQFIIIFLVRTNQFIIQMRMPLFFTPY